MMTKFSRMAISVLLSVAVFIVSSFPVFAMPSVSDGGKSLLTSALPQTDDDDDDMSGGALAVLLLAVGGAVAGVLYANLHDNDAPPKPGEVVTTPQTISFDKGSGQAVKVTLNETGRRGRSMRTEWTGRVDRSGAIKVNMGRTEWTGKADGSFSPVIGARSADEWSYTKINARTVGFTRRKAGKVTLTGRIAVTPDGRSFTITRNGVNLKGRRINTRTTYKMQ